MIFAKYNLMYLINRLLKKIRLIAVSNSTFDNDVKVEAGSTIIDTHIERHSFVGYDSNINNASIGPFCSIASCVNIGGAAHPIKFLSTSPVFLSHRDSVKAKFAYHEFKEIPRTIIGADVWIGQGAFIKAGVEIGCGAVIGMGAVVTKNVAPYAIVAGNPAKLIKYRFSEDVVDALLQYQWWNFDDKKLFEIGLKVNNPIQLLTEEGLI